MHGAYRSSVSLDICRCSTAVALAGSWVGAGAGAGVVGVGGTSGVLSLVGLFAASLRLPVDGDLFVRLCIASVMALPKNWWMSRYWCAQRKRRSRRDTARQLLGRHRARSR